MAVSKEDIQGWLQNGKRKGSTHVIVVCDWFDYSDFPVYVSPDENVQEIEKEWRKKSGYRVMEVYSLRRNVEAQLEEDRAFHLD